MQQLGQLPIHPVPDGVQAGALAAVLRIEGLVEHLVALSISDLAGLPRSPLTEHLSCTEGWSVPDLQWEGGPAERGSGFCPAAARGPLRPGLRRRVRGARGARLGRRGAVVRSPRRRAAAAGPRCALAPVAAQCGLLHQRELGRPTRAARRAGREYWPRDRPSPASQGPGLMTGDGR